jgi:cysteine desulfuration protein SufE
MMLTARRQILKERCSGIVDLRDQLTLLIEKGKAHVGLEEHERQDCFRVKSCASSLWVIISFDAEERLVFRADSGSVIMRGMLAILREVYDDAMAFELLSNQFNILQELNLLRHMSIGQQRTIAEIVTRILKAANDVVVGK